MKTTQLFSLFAASAAFALTASAADVSVKLTEVHLCCQNCVKGADAAVKPVTGAKDVADMETDTITITAPDNATAQKAVDALVAAGYFGKSSDSAIVVNAPTGAKEGKVASLKVTEVHLCCAKCVTAVTDVLAKVDGVKGNNVKSKATSFTVTGDFDPVAMFNAFHKIGLAGKVDAAAAPAAPAAAPKA